MESCGAAHIEVPCGDDVLAFDLDGRPGPGVLELGRRAAVDPVAATLRAIRDPIGSPPLAARVRPGGRVTILASDSTRVVRADAFMSVILDELNACGVPDGNITLVFARGNHRALSGEEMAALVGADVVARVRTVQHDSGDEAGLVSLGRTGRGTEVFVNRLAVECDLVVATGAAQFHDFAGFSGGPKSILPGISGRRTIQQNHSLLLNPEPGSGRHPRAVSGRLDNPVHEDMAEAARMVPRAFMVNSVVTTDGGIAGIFAGSFDEAHPEACRLVSSMFSAPIRERADLVVVSCGGRPRDINYYQATKAICNAAGAVKDGGVMILAAECREGLGADEFAYWFGGLRDVAAVDEALRRNFEVVGYFALMIRELTQQRGVTIVGLTGLEDEQARMVGLEPVGSPPEALAAARRKLGRGYAWCAIPNGCVTLPVLLQ